MTWSRGIEGPGLDIARSDDRRVRVVAGPGTGKTFALTRKVQRLLEQNVTPQRILVVTFTRVIAHDLKRELSNLGVPGCEDIRATTLHALCYGILRRGITQHTFDREPRPLLTYKKQGALQFEAAPMLRDISDARYEGVRSKTRLVEAYEAVWARLQADDPDVARGAIDAAFENDLVAWLTFHRAMLIGEVIPLAFRFLMSNPLAAERSAYDHIVVDEYQDLNRAEQAIIDLLAENATLTIVGDSDQSIYGFRYAHPTGIADFADRHENVVDYSMLDCRRCPTEVVRVASNVIQENHPSVPPALVPLASNPTGYIRIVQWASVAEEASGIAQFLASRISSGALPGSILVLSPRRYIGTEIRDACRRYGVPAHSFYHEELLDNEEAQHAFALLTLLSQPDDRVALRWYLGSKSGNWLSKQYASVRAICEAEGIDPRTVLDQLASGSRHLPRHKDLIGRYNELLLELGPLQGMEGQSLIDALFPVGLEWAAAFRELEIPDGPELAGPNLLLETYREYITQPIVPKSPDYVRIMSLHKSKGLTADYVVIAGVAQGILPRLDPDESPAERMQDLQEQRRLFYVATTRPRSELIISSPARLSPREVQLTRAQVGARGQTVASEFIAQMRLGARAVAGTEWAASGYR